MKTLKLKNSQLEILFKILDGDLPFSRSRRRKVFTDILQEKYKAREEARIALLDKFSKKGDDGKPVMKDNHYDIEDMEGFQKEFLVLYSEDVIIDLPPSVEEVLPVIKELVEKTDIVVKDAEVEMIEDIIKAFNDIK
jgi:hypothetical protein